MSDLAPAAAEGPAAPAPAAAPAASPTTPSTARRVTAAALAAELDAQEKAAPAAEPDVEPEKPSEPAEGEPEKPADDDGDADDDKADEDADEKPDDGEKLDAETQKRLDVVQRQAKRDREQLDRQRATAQRELEAGHAEFERTWRPKVEQAERVHGLLEKFHIDPTAIADELKLDADTQLYVAQQWYADAQAKKGDPKYRDQAARVRREREASGKTGELEKKLADVTARLEQQDAERRNEAAATRAAAAVGDKTPLVRHMLAKNPEYARERIRQATAYIRQQTGAEPDPSDVISKLEEVESQELTARGIDPKAAIAAVAAVAPKSKPTVAGEKQTAKPSSATAAKPAATQPPARLSRAERIAETARGLEERERSAG